jgi:hypothetical protein
MRRTSIGLTVLCLTLGASAAFAGTAPTVQPARKPAPVRVAPKAGGHHHHHHHQTHRPAPKKS